MQNSELTCGAGYVALSGLNVAAFAYRGLRSRGSLHPRLFCAAPSGLPGLLRSQFRIQSAECRIVPLPHAPSPRTGRGIFVRSGLPGHGRSGSLSPGWYIRARKRAQCRMQNWPLPRERGGGFLYGRVYPGTVAQAPLARACILRLLRSQLRIQNEESMASDFRLRGFLFGARGGVWRDLVYLGANDTYIGRI